MKNQKESRAKITLNIQHDYITLKLPVGNFTTSYGGVKASGELITMEGAFKAIDNYIKNKAEGSNMNYGDIMQELTNPVLMDQLVPGWDKPKVLDIKAGDTVKFSQATFAKKYPLEYEVVQVKGKYAFCKITEGKNIGFPLFALVKA